MVTHFLQQMVIGNTEPLTIEINSDEFVFGKLTVPYLRKLSRISEIHASFLQSDDGCCFVKDQNSLTGVYVNGKKISGKLHRLSPGDRIGFGGPYLQSQYENFICLFLTNFKSNEPSISAVSESTRNSVCLDERDLSAAKNASAEWNTCDHASCILTPDVKEPNLTFNDDDTCELPMEIRGTFENLSKNTYMRDMSKFPENKINGTKDETIETRMLRKRKRFNTRVASCEDEILCRPVNRRRLSSTSEEDSDGPPAFPSFANILKCVRVEPVNCSVREPKYSQHDQTIPITNEHEYFDFKSLSRNSSPSYSQENENISDSNSCDSCTNREIFGGGESSPDCEEYAIDSVETIEKIKVHLESTDSSQNSKNNCGNQTNRKVDNYENTSRGQPSSLMDVKNYFPVRSPAFYENTSSGQPSFMDVRNYFPVLSPAFYENTSSGQPSFMDVKNYFPVLSPAFYENEMISNF